jgi:hypothetical protein
MSQVAYCNDRIINGSWRVKITNLRYTEVNKQIATKKGLNTTQILSQWFGYTISTMYYQQN